MGQVGNATYGCPADGSMGTAAHYIIRSPRTDGVETKGPGTKGTTFRTGRIGEGIAVLALNGTYVLSKASSLALACPSAGAESRVGIGAVVRSI